MTTQTVLYDAAKKYLTDGTIDYDTNDIYCALLSSSYVPRSGVAARANTTSYAVNTVVTVGSLYYESTTAGVSAGSAPSFSTTFGGTTTDGTVVWTCWRYTPPSTHTTFADLSASEITGTGYTAGGAALTSKSIAQAVRSARFSAANVSWPGAVFTARYAALYRLGTGNAIVNPVICYILLSAADNLDVSAPSAANFELGWSSSGIFTF